MIPLVIFSIVMLVSLFFSFGEIENIKKEYKEDQFNRYL